MSAWLSRGPQSLRQFIEIPISPKLLFRFLILKNTFDSETCILELGKRLGSMLKQHRNYGRFPTGFISSKTPKKRIGSGQLESIKTMTLFNVSIAGRYRFRGPRHLPSCSECARIRVDLVSSAFFLVFAPKWLSWCVASGVTKMWKCLMNPNMQSNWKYYKPFRCQSLLSTSCFANNDTIRKLCVNINVKLHVSYLLSVPDFPDPLIERSRHFEFNVANISGSSPFAHADCTRLLLSTA